MIHCVIKLNYDYRIVPIEHHLKHAIELNREVVLSPRHGRNIDAPLTSIDIALSSSLASVSKESPHSPKERHVGHTLKRIVTRELLNRRNRPPYEEWRLND
jgi:hypothetical protein